VRARRNLSSVAGWLCVASFILVGQPCSAKPHRSSHECRICHKDIYKEWATSAHAHSFANPAFQEAYQRNHRPKECLRCHAPMPINETAFAAPPLPRKRNHADGVSCITCHSSGPTVHGPMGHRTTHNSCGNKLYSDPRQCAPCHGQACRCFSPTMGRHQRQLGDWSRGPFRFSVSCQDCHMPEKLSRTAQIRTPDLPARTRHSHSFPGADDAEFIKNAIECNIERRGDELLVTLINSGAGHRIPASEGRALILRITFLDDANLEFDHRTECLHARKNNRLRSGGSRVFSYVLRRGVRRVKLSLLFRHYDEQPERHWLLLQHRIFDLQRPFAPKPTHDIAERLRRIRAHREKIWKEDTTVSEWDP